jgi:DNA replication licensing factor MCM4
VTVFSWQILDKPNQESDRRLARHLVSLYHPNATRGNTDANTAAGNIDQTFLKEYIIFARSTLAPELGDDVVESLVQVCSVFSFVLNITRLTSAPQGYLNMRSMGGAGSKTISATPRQLESLIRISQVHPTTTLNCRLIVSTLGTS